MKTYLTILLLLLLVLAGSYEGLAQNNNLKPGLPDEEVIRLRSELAEAIEKNDMSSAKQIRDSLWNLQPSPWEYLTRYENFLCYYLFGEFTEVLRNYPQNMGFIDYATRFDDIDQSLRFEVRKRIQVIFTKLNEDFEPNEELVLSEFLFELLDHSAANNSYPELDETLSNAYGSNPGKKAYSQQQIKGKDYIGNSKYHRNEKTMHILYNISISTAAVSGVVALSSYLVADSKYDKYQQATTEANKLRSQVETLDDIAAISTIVMVTSLTTSLVFLVLESHFSEKADATVNLYSGQNGIGILVRL